MDEPTDRRLVTIKVETLKARVAADLVESVIQRLQQQGVKAEVLKEEREAIARAGPQVDYFEARNADTLRPLAASVGEPIRLLGAVRIGVTRLIDNLAVRSRLK